MIPAIETSIPARLDRLPWSRFHMLVVLALGITWVLDGIEVTMVGSVAGVLQLPQTLGLSGSDIGQIASAYVAGAVCGALGFGYLTDRLGRQRIFFITLAIYLVGVLLTAFSWNAASFAVFRLITGLGIGGEYAAINSAIDELIPARLRGRVDLIVNGSFWLGAALGAAGSLILLNGGWLPLDLGWRLGFGMGGIAGIAILVLRRVLPESPRWLVTHGRIEEAERVVADIERRVEAETGRTLPPAGTSVSIHPRKVFGFGLIARTMMRHYRRRAVLCLILMVSQACLYNALLSSYGLILVRFYGVAAEVTGSFIFPLAVGNFLGPLLLGRLFDTVGRRRMIAGTYAASAALLALAGWLFATGRVDAMGQTLTWSGIFFFASAAASSAYLTVSEIFPLEARAMAIALFYAVGTAAGGLVTPWLFGSLIDSGGRGDIFLAYLGVAALLAVAAIAEAVVGVDAEARPLEEVAPPLSLQE